MHHVKTQKEGIHDWSSMSKCQLCTHFNLSTRDSIGSFQKWWSSLWKWLFNHKLRIQKPYPWSSTSKLSRISKKWHFGLTWSREIFEVQKRESSIYSFWFSSEVKTRLAWKMETAFIRRLRFLFFFLLFFFPTLHLLFIFLLQRETFFLFHGIKNALKAYSWCLGQLDKSFLV